MTADRRREESERKIWNGETDIKPAWYDEFEKKLLGGMRFASSSSGT